MAAVEKSTISPGTLVMGHFEPLNALHDQAKDAFTPFAPSTVTERFHVSRSHGARKPSTRPGTTENPLRPAYSVNFEPQLSA